MYFLLKMGIFYCYVRLPKRKGYTSSVSLKLRPHWPPTPNLPHPHHQEVPPDRHKSKRWKNYQTSSRPHIFPPKKTDVIAFHNISCLPDLPWFLLPDFGDVEICNLQGFSWPPISLPVPIIIKIIVSHALARFVLSLWKSDAFCAGTPNVELFGHLWAFF